MNEEILRLKKRKQELEKAIEFTKQNKKKIIEIAQKLASKLGSKTITRKQHEEELKKALKNRTAEQWIKYYDDYLDYYNYQIKLCDKLIRQEKFCRIKETAGKKAVPALKISIVIAVIALIFTLIFILKPVGIGVFEKIGEKVSASIKSLTVPQAPEEKQKIKEEQIFEEPKVPVVLEDKSVLIKEESLIQYPAIIGKSVKWKKTFAIGGLTGFSVELPKDSENIKVKVTEDGKEKDITEIADIKNKRRFFIFEKNVEVEIKEQNVAGITGNAVDEQNQEEREFEIEYETSAPEIKEEITEKGKRIIINGPDDVHYKDVLSFTALPKEIDKNEIKRLKFYEIKNNEKIKTNFIAYDTDENGLLDYIEWFTPELSEAVFELIIEITKAEHLDENRSFMNSIYNEVYELDGIWSEEINDEEYVRVTFKQKLDNARDITIYPRIAQGQPRIEVYEVNGSEKIAEFTSLNSNEYNKVYLTNLQGEQDTFDLKVIDGSVEIEHIIDPLTNVFFDNFNDGFEWTYWTETDGTGWINSNNACGHSAGVYSGSGYSACAESGFIDILTMKNPVDLTPYDSCILNYATLVSSSLDNGEYFYVDVTNSAGSWINIYSCTNRDACEDDSWHLNTYNITSGVGLNNNFKIRVQAVNNDGAEEVGFDSVNITCYFSKKPQFSNPKINETEVFFGNYVNHSITVYMVPTQYLFSWNAGGGNCDTWVNSSWISVSTNPAFISNASLILTACKDKVIEWRFCANNSVGINCSDIQTYNVLSYGTLVVNLTYPGDNFAVQQNNTFDLNATITCSGGTNAKCGIVNAYSRYNKTSATPDTDINTSFDFPFYIIGGGSTSLNSWNYSQKGENYGVTVDLNDDFIVVGTNSTAWHMMRFSSNNEKLWDYQEELGGGGADVGYSVATDSNNNFIVAGYDANGWRIMKFNSNNQHIWNLSIDLGGIDKANAVAVDSNNNFIVAGYNATPSSPFINFWKIMKFDSNNNNIWNYSNNFGGTNRANSVATDSNNNFIVTGYDGIGWRIMKFDSNNNNIWGWSGDLGGSDIANAVAVDSNNNFIVGGSNGSGWYLMKFDSNNNNIWNYSIDFGATAERIQGIATDSNNNFIAAGYDGSGWRIIRFNSNNENVWNYSIDFGGSLDIAMSVATDSNDNFIVAGYNGTEAEVGWIMRFDSLSSAQKSLSQGETWNVSWKVNATGSGSYELGILFNSSYGSSNVANNYTKNVTVNIGGDATPLLCGNLNIPNTVYTLTQNVSSPGTCFNITANNVTLDCNGYEINYSSSGVLGYGIDNSGGYNFTTIKDCIIKEGNPATSGKYAIYFRGASNGTIYNNSIITSGTLGYGIYLSLSSNSNTLSNNTITTSGSAGDGIHLSSSSNSNTLSNNTITTSGTLGYGIYLSSSSNNNSFSGMNIETSGSSGYAFYIYDTNHNFIISDSILNSSRAGVQEFYVRNTVTGGTWNFTNVTRANGNPIDIFWSSGANGTLNMHWYLDVNVTNSTGDAVENANVTAWNRNNILQFSANTTAAGFIPRQILLEYTNINNTLKTYFSNYTVNTTKTGYANNSRKVNMSINRKLDVVLGAEDTIPPSISFVFPTPDEGSTQNYSVYVNVSASDVGRGDNNISTFIDFDKSLVGWWRMDDVVGWQYQENANETTNTAPSEPYIYMNYTKPAGASPRSLWQVKHGRLNDYNVTIPLDCWNYDSSKLVLRVKADWYLEQASYGECKYSGSDWMIITNVESGGGSCDSNPASYNNILDGNWNTMAFYNGATWSQQSGTPDCQIAEFYEEAMNWFVEGAGNSVADMSEYANTGTAFGNAVQTDEGYFGKGFSFDGNGDYIELPASNKVLTQNKTFTFSLWFNANEFVVIPGDYLIAIRGPGGIGAAIFTEESGGNKRVQWQYATDPTSTIGSLIKDNLETNKWYHVAFTYNETAAVSYYNGQRTYSLENPPQFFGFDLSTGIIGALASNSRFFNGTIDDVMIFNRALSAEEVIGLYANTSTRFLGVNFTELVEGTHSFKAYAQDTFGNVNSTEKREVNVVSGPKIIWVQNISEITPLPGEIKAIDIKFTAYYGGGYANLNDSSAEVNFIKQGILRDGTCSRIVSESFGNYANYTCSVGMWYYDEEGSWDINASIADNDGNFGINNSNSFFYKFLYSFEMVPDYVNWSNVETGSIDKLSDNNITIRNFGNTNIINASVNGTNLSGKTYPQYQIPAANFSFSNSSFNPCSGSRLKENENVSIKLFINYSNSLFYNSANNTIGFCLNGLPAGAIAQEYETESGKHWDINVVFGFFISMKYLLAVAVVVRKKKKNKKFDNEDILKILERKLKKHNLGVEELLRFDESLKKKYGADIKKLLDVAKEKRKQEKELQIPIIIFRQKISPAEVICKYLKENIGLRLSEIAKLLNRDERTIWINYRNAAKKMREKIKADSKILISIDIFSDRKLSILESIVKYLKEKGFRNVEIAELLGKDQRNIYTLYNRANKKLK